MWRAGDGPQNGFDWRDCELNGGITSVAQEPSPAFQFYVKEWRSSRNVIRMSFGERGMYLEMLLEQWEKLSLPNTPEAVADALGGDVNEWLVAWPVLIRNFVAHKRDANAIVNLKLEEVRNRLKVFKGRARSGGLKRAKSASRSSNGTYLPATQPAIIQPPAGAVSSQPLPANPASSSPSPSPSASPTASSSAAGAATPTRGSEHGRIFLHRWQVDALISTLGPHASTFGLDTWVCSLSALADSKGLILEKKGVWGWVQGQFIEEIARRGLPIAGAAPSADDNLARMRAEIEQQNALVRRA